MAPIDRNLGLILDKRIEIVKMIHDSLSSQTTERVGTETGDAYERIVNEVLSLRKVMTSLIEDFHAICQKNNIKSKSSLYNLLDQFLILDVLFIRFKRITL